MYNILKLTNHCFRLKTGSRPKTRLPNYFEGSNWFVKVRIRFLIGRIDFPYDETRFF